MPCVARSAILQENEVVHYHLINRTVRRAFLCGNDAHTGKNYDYRRQWFVIRMAKLQEVFLIDVGSYAVMNNHFHLSVRTRPDLAKKLSDKEVLERWHKLYPIRDKVGGLIDISQEIFSCRLADKDFIKERRRRLSCISWYMKSLTEWIARKANKEDSCTGRFWEGRFKAQVLLDEKSVLACSVYIDLNPIKANLAKTPETSDFTSIKERIETLSSPERRLFLVAFRACLSVFEEEAPFLLIDEKDYIDIVTQYALGIVDKKDIESRMGFANIKELDLVIQSNSRILGTKESRARYVVQNGVRRICGKSLP